MPLEFIISSKGKSILVHDGYEFWLKKKAVRGHVNWRCAKHQSLKCPVTLVTNGEEVIRQSSSHNHEGNLDKAMAKNAIGKMKEKMASAAMTTTSTACQAAVKVELTPSVLRALPSASIISRTLNRHRKRLRDGEIVGSDTSSPSPLPPPLPPPPSEATFDLPAVYNEFLLYDSMETGDKSDTGGGRFLIFGDRSLLDWLERSKCWFADGTFKVVPGLPFQLYTVHFQLEQGVIPPVLYCLLQDKSRTTFDRLLDAVKGLVPNAAPETVMTDFDRSCMAAYREKFRQCTVTGCYFHMSQAVLRKVGELGMRRDYDESHELRQMIRCLPTLALVPEEDLVDSFEALEDAMPENDRMPELLSFFEHSFVRGRRLPRGRGRGGYRPALFPPETWNGHLDIIGGVARTSNAVEGWHHALECLLSCHKATLWSLLDGLQKDIRRHGEAFVQACASADPAPHPKRKYVALAKRIASVLRRYETVDRLAYLRSLAELSY